MGQISMRDWHLRRSSSASEPWSGIRAGGGSDSRFVPRTTIRPNRTRWDSTEEASRRLEHSVDTLVLACVGSGPCVVRNDAKDKAERGVDDRARNCAGVVRTGRVVWGRRENNRTTWRRYTGEHSRGPDRECGIPAGDSDGRRNVEGEGRHEEEAKDWVQIRRDRRNLLYGGDGRDVLRSGNTCTAAAGRHTSSSEASDASRCRARTREERGVQIRRDRGEWRDERSQSDLRRRTEVGVGGAG